MTTEAQVQLGKVLVDVCENHRIFEKSYLVLVHTLDMKRKYCFDQDGLIYNTECSWV